MVAAFGLGSLLSQPIGGWLSDRAGRRRVLVTSVVGTAAAYLALGAARTTPALVLCAFAAGLATDAYRPAVAAMVADLVPFADRRRAYGLLYWAVNVGVGVASVAGGALAEHNFGLLFVLNAVACLAFAAIVGLAVPETKPPTPATVRTILPRDPLLLALTASCRVDTR